MRSCPYGQLLFQYRYPDEYGIINTVTNPILEGFMSKIVFLGDLHGNFVATKAMEEEIASIKPDLVWFLGDAVGKGPENIETCDWVREHCDLCLKGNWDDFVYECYSKRDDPNQHPFDKENVYFGRQLGEERLNWLYSLPYESEILISGLRFRLVHGRPTDQLLQGYDGDEKFAQSFCSIDKKTQFDSLICADSHRPYVRAMHEGYAINTGSVGNSIGVPRAHGLLIEGDLDSEKISPIRFTILSVPYDNQRAADIAIATEGLPMKESFAKEVLTGIYSR